MRVEMRKGADANNLDLPQWQVALRGVAVDDRGRAAIGCIVPRSSIVLSLSYEPDEFKLNLNGAVIEADRLLDALKPFACGRILLEASTLGFAEILLCCRAFQRLGLRSFDFLYVEPLTYRTPRSERLLHRRDFELSGIVPGYRAIPGFGVLLGDRQAQRGVFFLGYEDARLRRALEDLQMIQSERTTLAFGVPAFQPGWEMDAIANNIGVVSEHNLRGGVHFCGADNPAGAIEILSQVKSALAAGERMFVAPIGTKPHGIGAALFAAANSGIGIIYDHPNRTPKRSDSIAGWHLFTVHDF